MTASVGAARGDDCGSLREAGLAYAALEIGEQLYRRINLRYSL
jgi:hypothetical protein